MNAGDYVEEVVWSFRKQKLRTFLTASGIGIGAFALALMVALGEGLQTYIESRIRAFGDPRVVMVFPEVTAKASEKLMDRISSFGKPAEPVSEEDEKEKKARRGGLWITATQAAALRALAGVQSVAPFIGLDVDGVRLAAGPGEKEGKWYQVGIATLVSNPLLGRVSAGRLPVASAAEDDGTAAETSEVVLSPQYARSFGVLGPDDPSHGRAAAGDPGWLVGREVELRVPQMTDIAARFVFRDPTAFKDVHRVFRARIVGLAEESPLSRVVFTSIPLGRAVARYQSGKSDFLSDDKMGYQAIVRVASDADPVQVKEAIRGLGLAARSAEDELKEVSTVFVAIDSFLTVFGLIAIFVATFGIVNTLLMAITERTREIGVMKALGATRATIRLLFAVEAAAIGVVGGCGGALAALTAGEIGNFLARSFPVAEALKGYSVFVFPWWLLAGAVLFATLVGALAGIYPANRAASLDPIDALRYE